MLWPVDGWSNIISMIIIKSMSNSNSDIFYWSKLVQNFHDFSYYFKTQTVKFFCELLSLCFNFISAILMFHLFCFITKL